MLVSNGVDLDVETSGSNNNTATTPTTQQHRRRGGQQRRPDMRWTQNRKRITRREVNSWWNKSYSIQADMVSTNWSHWGQVWNNTIDNIKTDGNISQVTQKGKQKGQRSRYAQPLLKETQQYLIHLDLDILLSFFTWEIYEKFDEID